MASILAWEIALLLLLLRVIHGLLALRWVAVALGRAVRLGRVIAAAAAAAAVVVVGSAALGRAVGAGIVGGRRV